MVSVDVTKNKILLYLVTREDKGWDILAFNVASHVTTLPIINGSIVYFKGIVVLSDIPLDSLGRWALCTCVAFVPHSVQIKQTDAHPGFSFHDLFSDGLYFIRVIFSTIFTGNAAHYAMVRRQLVCFLAAAAAAVVVAAFLYL